MELAVHGFSVDVDELEGVTAITVHVSVAHRGASVTEQKADLQKDIILSLYSYWMLKIGV